MQPNLTPLGTSKYPIHSGVPPQLPQDKSTAVWEVNLADREGRYLTQALEEAPLRSLLHQLLELPTGSSDAKRRPPL